MVRDGSEKTFDGISGQKKKLIYNDCSIFGILCLKKSFSESAMGF